MRNLPSTYQEVEYIQSSGTQRIDTGLKPTDATFGFKGRVNMTAASGDWNIISINGTSTTDYLYRYSVQGSGTQWQTSNIMTSPSGWANVGTVATGTDYEFSYNYNSDRKFTVNGIDLKTGLTASSYSSYGVNWNIFCAASGTGSGTYSRYGSFKLYYLHIYQGTTLVRDFVPCYRKSDNEIGLYDLVNNQFYTNAGTGTFTKGDDVKGAKIQRIYVGSNLVRPTEITKTFRVSDVGVSLYKAGYKIKEVTIQYTTYTSSSGWLSSSWGILMNNGSSEVDYRAIFRMKSEWHYSSYVDAGFGMVGGWRKDNGTSGDTQIKRFASSATNSSGGSCILTFNENGGRIRVGTTFGTRIQDETYTHDSAKKTRTQTIFNSQYVKISGYGDGTISNDLMTVTREPAN